MHSYDYTIRHSLQQQQLFLMLLPLLLLQPMAVILQLEMPLRDRELKENFRN